MGFKGPTVSVLVAELLQCSDVDISKFEMQQVRLMMSVCYFFKDTEKQNDIAFAPCALLYRDRHVHQLMHKNCTGD